MNQKTFNQVAGIIFAFIAVMHLLRLLFGWHITITGRTAPMGVSVAALVLFAFLAWSAFKLKK